MTHSFTADNFYRSAREFARTALIAHGKRDFRRVAVDAATCLEHLAKACLTSRSPALLVELKSERNFSSLLQLLEIPDRDSPGFLRTVGLRDALVRVEKFVTSPASKNDLSALVEMRDGSIHAAQNDQVEDRLLIAFIQHTDALLGDLKRDHARFWNDYAEVVDALLADATDKVAYRVSVKLAAARSEYQKFATEVPSQLQKLVPRLFEYRDSEFDEEVIECPVCASPATADGYHDVEWVGEGDDISKKEGHVWFYAHRVSCPICKLSLSGAEITAVMDEKWEVENADPVEWESLLSENG